MTFGPIDFIALEFPGNHFKGEILPDLFELVDRGVIRMLDLVIIMKDADGALRRARASGARAGHDDGAQPAEGRSQPDDHGRRHRQHREPSSSPTAPRA